MSKRKEAEACSETSEVYNPEKGSDFHPTSPYGFDQIPNWKKKRSMALNVNSSTFTEDTITASEYPNLCASFQVEASHVRLNGEPFKDFLAQEIKDGHNIQERNVSDVSPSLSNSCSNHSPVMSQSNISEFDNCHKENRSDSGTGTGVNSVQTPSVSSTDSPCTKVPMLFGVPLYTCPIDAVPLRMYHPNIGDIGIRVNPPQQVEWTMKKVLAASDCNAQHRLMISKKLVEDNLISHLDALDRVEISSLDGFRVDVLDCNIGLLQKLTLKKWPSSKCYGLMDNWRRDFVYRRGLKPGDEVGLCWDKHHNRLLFSVLKRSPLVEC